MEHGSGGKLSSWMEREEALDTLARRFQKKCGEDDAGTKSSGHRVAVPVSCITSPLVPL